MLNWHWFIGCSWISEPVDSGSHVDKKPLVVWRPWRWRRRRWRLYDWRGKTFHPIIIVHVAPGDFFLLFHFHLFHQAGLQTTSHHRTTASSRLFLSFSCKMQFDFRKFTLLFGFLREAGWFVRVLWSVLSSFHLLICLYDDTDCVCWNTTLSPRGTTSHCSPALQGCRCSVVYDSFFLSNITKLTESHLHYSFVSQCLFCHFSCIQRKSHWFSLSLSLSGSAELDRHIPPILNNSSSHPDG